MKAFLTCLFLAFPAALPAAPYLVKDLNTLSGDSFTPNLKSRGTSPGVSYFVAADDAHGFELWRSDGTSGGTERLTDICAGRCDSLSFDYSIIKVRAGRIFFNADDGLSGTELWVSDGTPGSERRVRDVCPGSCGTAALPVEEVGGRLVYLSYFPLNDADNNDRLELWQTDGTREGTARVKVLCPSGCYVDDQMSIGGKALFLVNGYDLWVTDGTADGTRLFHQFQSSVRIVPGDGFAWALNDDGLWRTDGTEAGTFLLQPLDQLTTPSTYPHQLDETALWHGMFFGILRSGEVIRSDGTAQGTFRIASFPEGSGTAGLAPLDNELLFLTFQSSDASVLWSTRGTVDTTGPGIDLAAGLPASLTSLGGPGGSRAVFLSGPNESYDSTQLWVTDGTAAGTRPLALPPGIVSRDGALFATGDGRALFIRDYALWVTDGTEAGTHAVRSPQETTGSSGPVEQAALGGARGDALGGKLVFSAAPSFSPAFLYVSDGTAAGTELLSQKAQEAFSFFPFSGRLLFSASERLTPPNLWATDGTPTGTKVLSRETGFSHPALLDGGQILFSGDGGGGSELWKMDSLTGSVNLVKDIDPFIVAASHHTCSAESSHPVLAGVVNGRMLLAAYDGRSGRELWTSDGTAAGTGRVRDINPGRSPGPSYLCPDPPRGPHRHDFGLSSNPEGFVLLGSVALFTADDGLTGRELWVSNGTLPGTRRVADLIPGPRGSAPHDLVRLGTRVYFLASNVGAGSLGESLWKTDGTPQGTARVLDLTLDSLPSWGRGLTVAAGRLFFSVYNETTGAELWASTGETSGTKMVVDLNPGPGSSSPQFLTAQGRFLLFAADDGLTGLEPWRSDGTAAGTVRVSDIAPGRDASSPGPFTVLPSLVMTGADDGVHGRELWAIPKADIALAPE